MGQKRPVTIYRLISKGTIEEGMLQVAREKLNLEREVTTNTGMILFFLFLRTTIFIQKYFRE